MFVPEEVENVYSLKYGQTLTSAEDQSYTHSLFIPSMAPSPGLQTCHELWVIAAVAAVETCMRNNTNSCRHRLSFVCGSSQESWDVCLQGVGVGRHERAYICCGPAGCVHSTCRNPVGGPVSDASGSYTCPTERVEGMRERRIL